jgi:hypothetical protein
MQIKMNVTLMWQFRVMEQAILTAKSSSRATYRNTIAKIITTSFLSFKI